MTGPDLPAPVDDGAIENVVVNGDLSKLTPLQRVSYYRMRCEAAGLDPRAQPFQYLVLQGKTVLYATRAATQQLAANHGISLSIVSRTVEDGLCVVVVRAEARDGRTTDEIGAVTLTGKKGDDHANAIMKATTKAKRRAVLAICGLGELDETEVETVPRAKRIMVDTTTGEILPDQAPKPAPSPEVLAAADEARELVSFFGDESKREKVLALVNGPHMGRKVGRVPENFSVRSVRTVSEGSRAPLSELWPDGPRTGGGHSAQPRRPIPDAWRFRQ